MINGKHSAIILIDSKNPALWKVVLCDGMCEICRCHGCQVYTAAAEMLDILAAEKYGDTVCYSVPFGFGGYMWLISMNLWPMLGVFALLYLVWFYLNW